MPPKKAITYGKKKTTTTSFSSNLIFGAPSPDHRNRLNSRQVLATGPLENQATTSHPISPDLTLPPPRNVSSKHLPTSDPTEKVIIEAHKSDRTDDAIPDNVDSSFAVETLNDEDLDAFVGLSRLSLHSVTVADGGSIPEDGTGAENQDNEQDPSFNDQDPSFVDPVLKRLDEIFSEEQFEFCNSTWAQLLPANDCKVIKIAEATYAEVYRVTTLKGSSIVKIMPLIIPSDIDSSTRHNASRVDDVIPELQIMDELTVIPGFVKFKQAWIVKGQHSKKFVEAWERWQSRMEEISDFAHPATYSPNATFLAIELDDAGEVLEDVVIDEWNKFWDLFLGVVTALAIAEEVNQFEHRDLHENNICVLSNEIPAKMKFPNVDYGRSGLSVTLIDYGLSRARLTRKFLEDESTDEVVAFKDLELDLEVFQGPKGQRQFDTYRQMRSYLYNGTTKKMPAKFHKDSILMEQAGKSWEEYTPYSNVLWLSYIFYYLYEQYTDFKFNPSPATVPIPEPYNSSVAFTTSERDEVDSEPQELERMTEGLKKLFSPSTTRSKGGFSSAGEVFMFCVEQEWIVDGMINTPVLPAKVDHALEGDEISSEIPKNNSTRGRGAAKTRGRGAGRGRGRGRGKNTTMTTDA